MGDKGKKHKPHGSHHKKPPDPKSTRSQSHNPPKPPASPPRVRETDSSDDDGSIVPSSQPAAASATVPSATDPHLITPARGAAILKRLKAAMETSEQDAVQSAPAPSVSAEPSKQPKRKLSPTKTQTDPTGIKKQQVSHSIPDVPPATVCPPSVTDATAQQPPVNSVITDPASCLPIPRIPSSFCTQHVWV